MCVFMKTFTVYICGHYLAWIRKDFQRISYISTYVCILFVTYVYIVPVNVIHVLETHWVFY